MMFVTVISVLFNTTGIELETQHEADLERELMAVGTANLLSAGLSGYVSCTSLSRTTLNYGLGGRGRLSGLTVAAISAVVLAAGSDFLAYVPKFILGGLLLFSGVYLLHRWLLDSWRYLSRVEYLLLAGIALLIVEWGFIAGVLIGIVVGLATFALSVTRVHPIKFNFDGSEYHSSLDRRPYELALLSEYGWEIQGMFLHSYLFFGSTNALYRHVKALLAKQKCRFLLFDFRLVTGIDSSAVFSFIQIKRVVDECGARIVLTCLTPDVETALRARFISEDLIVAPNLDHALESCENAIIKVHQAQDSEAGTLRGWFTEALAGAENADQLIQHCKRIEVQPGEVIVRQGDPANSMHFLLDGRVGIMVDTGGHPVRVRSLGPHTTIGEMGLITRQPRSATIQAERLSVLYELSANAYERIMRENPALSHALLTYVVAVMSERLNFASRIIGVLQR
jgi:sulfate permease, SulP family